MASGGLPADVRRLLDRHIDSALDLEIILLFHREERDLGAAEVAAALRADPDHVQRTLDRLAAAKLLHPDRGTRRTIADLAKAYETHRVTVIQAIFSKPSEAVRGFADAFRLRDDEDDE